MAAIGKIIQKKEKEYIIIIMVIEKWVIFLMIIQLESMYCLKIMEKFKLLTINRKEIN